MAGPEETYDRRREHIKSTLSLAALPVLTEGLGLLVDGVKNLRADLEAERIARAECAPVERQIRMAELKARLEELEFESDERKADREERQADREERQADRYLAKVRREKQLDRLNRGDVRVYAEDDVELDDDDARLDKKWVTTVNGTTRFSK